MDSSTHRIVLPYVQRGNKTLPSIQHRIIFGLSFHTPLYTPIKHFNTNHINYTFSIHIEVQDKSKLISNPLTTVWVRELHSHALWLQITRHSNDKSSYCSPTTLYHQCGARAFLQIPTSSPLREASSSNRPDWHVC